MRGDGVVAALVAVALGLIGLAAFAVLVSPQAQSANVIKAGSTGFAGLLNAATAPVSGSTFGSALATPGLQGW